MEKKIETLNEEKIKLDWSEVPIEIYARTKSGNVIMYLIVAVSVIVFVVTGRGSVAVQLSMGCLILSICQYLWQGFLLELFLRKLEHNKLYEFDSYPSHIGTGGWIIYVFKMIVAILAAVELILSV